MLNGLALGTLSGRRLRASECGALTRDPPTPCRLRRNPSGSCSQYLEIDSPLRSNKLLNPLARRLRLTQHLDRSASDPSERGNVGEGPEAPSDGLKTAARKCVYRQRSDRRL